MSEKYEPYKVSGSNTSLENFKTLPCSCDIRTGEYIPPTAEQFSALCHFLGLSIYDAYQIVGRAQHEYTYIDYSEWRLILITGGIVQQELITQNTIKY